MASVNDTLRSINEALQSTGGAHRDYSCKFVAWEDAQRSTVGGGLSCWGSNITDVRLWAKDGRSLFTVRTDNFNEKLGTVPASEVAVLVGNEARGGGTTRPITLQDYLANLGQHGAYAGVPKGTSLHNAAVDQECSIRFQTTFLPIGDGELANLEFTTEHYNYQARSNENPKNICVLATTQGSALQQDGRGAVKLYHHAVDPAGKVHRYWLEAERSKHAVGGAQHETDEERAEAAARGKATASVIGIKALGTRFNVLLSIQVPLEQPKPKPCGAKYSFGGGALKCAKSKKKKKKSLGFGGLGSLLSASMGVTASMGSANLKCASIDNVMDVQDDMHEVMFASLSCSGVMDDDDDDAWDDFDDEDCEEEEECSKPSRRARAAPGGAARVGRSNAARVSRGSEVDTWGGLKVKAPKRDASQRVTITVTTYYTVQGGVPSVEDVKKAVDDLEQLYAACGWQGRLADAAHLTKELTVAEAGAIAEKISAQPYKPPPPALGAAPVANFDVFPTSSAA